MTFSEDTLSKQNLFNGIVFNVERIEVRLETGAEAKRDIVRHAGGVGILARDPEGRFLLVRQFRKAIECDCLEIVAGMREPGEAPEVTGKRELEEETGYTASTLHYLGRYLPSPGYTDEVDHLYFAELTGRPVDLALDHDERLEVCRFSKAEMESLLRENKMCDGKSIAAWFFAIDKGYI